jgi:agmatinase
VFSGISTFGRLPYSPCLATDDVKYDIAFIGTSPTFLYFSGVHQGVCALILVKVPHSILELLTDQELASAPLVSDKVLVVSIFSTFPCQTYTDTPSLVCIGSRRIGFSGGYNVPLETNPFNSWATVIDCGDIPVTSYVAPLPLSSSTN